MDRHITHPTKEQVRAYMARRESALRPPAAPADIRRELGWRMAPADDQHPLVRFCHLPTTCTQLTAQLVVEWLSASARAFRPIRRLK
jgi:hypothetical protein